MTRKSASPLQKILVLTVNLEHFRLIQEVLQDSYWVVNHRDFNFDHDECDLVISDPVMIDKYRSWVNHAKMKSDLETLAVLGLIPPNSLPDSTPTLYPTTYFEKFDEVIQLPITKADLTRRVNALLNLRQLLTINRKLRERLEKQVDVLRIKTSEAESANQAKSTFLANMSHEIRTPLNAILGFSDLLKEALLSDDEKNYLSIIRRNGQALTKLIDDILDLSKVEAGKLRYEEMSFSISDLIDDVLNLFSEKAASKNLRLLRVPNVDLSIALFSDPSRLRQILINILGNAVKFTDRGSVVLSTHQKTLDQSHSLFFITITDTGIGMSDEQRERVFQPFVQADAGTSRRFGGTGLGLILSRRLAQGLGGDVKITSTVPNEGTTFEISFIARIDETPITVSTPAIFTTVDQPPRTRILLVDDSEDNRVLMKLMLSKRGYIVDTAVDGRDGVQKAMEGTYVLVLMDIQMPRMDGYEAMNELNKRGYSRPVIALTAHAMSEERAKTRQAGFSAHLVKPIEIDKMITTIEEWSTRPQE